MNASSSSSSSSGIGFLGLLTIVFITLKLIGEVTWTWTWVLAPMWIPFALGFLLFTVLLLVYVYKALKDNES